MSFKFWSIYNGGSNEPEDREWLCIPPNKKYIPEEYPKGALIKHHSDEILPPPSYWFRPEYESMVYMGDY